jgi:Ca2+-transporting ATPase
MAAAIGVLLAAVLGIAWLRQLMGLAMPDGQGLALGLVMLASCVAWLALVRRGLPGLRVSRIR